LGAISNEGRGLYRGCYWSHKTRFAVFDIDQGSKYHNAADLADFAAKLAAIGLTAKPYRSSFTGGWHVYLFFDDWAESGQVNQTLKRWLKAQGYELKSGTLETFPSGNALRLPLQKGFAWLAPEGDLLRSREDIREDEALASFLLDLEENQRNWSEAKNRIESQFSLIDRAAGAGTIAHTKAISLEGLEDLYGRGKIQEQWEKGREWWRRGLFERGQRHDAVLAVGHYLWYGDPESNIPAYPGARHNDTRARLIEAWLTEKHNGHCRHIREGHWQIVTEQIARAVVWRGVNVPERGTQERPYYPLTDRLLKRLLEVYKKTGQLWDVDRMAQANIDRCHDARARIARAVSECVDNGWQITRNGLAEMAGCHRDTVSKHKDLWFLLVSGPGVYITRGAGGDLPALASPENCSGVLEEKKEKDLSGSETQGDSRQAYGCWQWDTQESETERDLEQAASLCSAVAPPSPPLAAASLCLVADSTRCLTPYADLKAGDGERLTASDSLEVLPPSLPFSLAPGSSTDLEGLGNPCGINWFPPTLCAGPSHLFLGDFFLLGLRSSQHQQVWGSSAAGSGGRGALSVSRLSFRKRTERRSGWMRGSYTRQGGSQRGPPLPS